MQLVIFFHNIDGEITMTQELVSLYTMNDITIGDDILKRFFKYANRV